MAQLFRVVSGIVPCQIHFSTKTESSNRYWSRRIYTAFL